MHKKFACLSMMAVFFSCSDAFAEARNEEVVHHPSLLMLGDITQVLGLAYNYAGHTSRESSTSATAFSESYGVGTEAAILDPDLAYLQISASVSSQQQMSSNSNNSSTVNGQYNVIASLFGMSYYPVTAISTRTSTLVANGYTPSYTLMRTSNQVSAALLHAIFPLRVFYGHSSLETSGGVVSSSSTSDAFGFGLHHDLPEISTTDLLGNFESSESQGNDMRSYSASLTNELSIDRKKRYQLLSRASISDSKSSNVPQRQVSLSEGLTCRFGKVLLGTLTDQYSYSSTVDFDNKEQTLGTNVVSASLSHRLYKSLTTSVSGSYRRTDTLGGTESGYGALANLGYTKVLPRQSQLSLNSTFGRTVTEQNFAGSLLAARDEKHTVAQQGDRVAPDLAGRLVSVISVKSLNPEIFYLEGVDYRVDFDLGNIEILVAGGIAPGTELLVSYTVQVNQKLTYQTDIMSASSNLSIVGGRYLFGADYSVSSQSIISGQAANQALVSTTAMGLRADAVYAASSLGAEFSTFDSTQQKLSRLGMHWNYSRSFFGADKATMSARDTYTMYAATDTSRASSNNVISLATSYSRRYFDWLRGVVALNLSDSRQAGRSSNLAMLRIGLDGTFNQLNFNVNGQTVYRVTGDSKNRDDVFQFSVTRAF